VSQQGKVLVDAQIADNTCKQVQQDALALGQVDIGDVQLGTDTWRDPIFEGVDIPTREATGHRPAAESKRHRLKFRAPAVDREL
jgi:hypothetical protein